jgi:hypothetical protein
VEADHHYTNLFAVVVGQTSKARKGTSLGQVQRVFKDMDDQWCSTRVMGGLSSGEGLIWGVRMVSLRDPDGNNLYLLKWLKDRHN